MKGSIRDLVVVVDRLQSGNSHDVVKHSASKYVKAVDGKIEEIAKEIGYSKGFTRFLCYLHFYLSANGVKIFDKPTPLNVAIKEILKNQAVREKILIETERLFPIVKEASNIEMLERRLLRKFYEKNPKRCYLSVKDFLKLHPDVRKQIPYQEKEMLVNNYAIIIVEVPEKYKKILEDKGLI